MVDPAPLFSSLDLGSLAALVLVLVPSLSLVILVSLLVRQFSVGQTEIHCARCHSLVAVQGVSLPPRSLHSAPAAPPSLRPGGTHSLLRQAPLASPLLGDNQKQAAIRLTVDPPSGGGGATMADSATFQRLGMHRPNSRISEEARTLESQALSLQSSPPDTGQGEVFPSGLEPLTPSPVTQAARKVTYQEKSVPPNKLDQVRVLQFLNNNTPTTKTPRNAAKGQRPISGAKRSVAVLEPSRIFHHDKARDEPLLEVSHLNRTEVTVGDLEELCETSLMTREEQGEDLSRDRSADFSREQSVDLSREQSVDLSRERSSDLSRERSAHTPASVESGESQSRTVTEKSLQDQLEVANSQQPGLSIGPSPQQPFYSSSSQPRTVIKRPDEASQGGGAPTGLLASGPNPKFVTTRDEESMARSLDEVFLGEGESESFKQQVGEQQAGGYVHPLGEVPYVHPLCPRTSVENRSLGSGGGSTRSSSALPMARKQSLVEIMEKQREEGRLFSSSLEQGAVKEVDKEQGQGAAKALPPLFPAEGRRQSWVGQGAESSQII